MNYCEFYTKTILSLAMGNSGFVPRKSIEDHLVSKGLEEEIDKILSFGFNSGYIAFSSNQPDGYLVRKPTITPNP